MMIYLKTVLELLFCVCAGRHYCSLLLFCFLRDWSTVSEPWEGIQGSQNRHVHPCFHRAAVLLLCWLAQGLWPTCVLLWKKPPNYLILSWKHSLICTLGGGADHQPIWWRWWRLWNQPADWPKLSGYPLLSSTIPPEHLSAVCHIYYLGSFPVKVSMLAVDDMYQNLAPLVKDKHWGQKHFSIPYTLSTAAENLKPAFKGSTFNLR